MCRFLNLTAGKLILSHCSSLSFVWIGFWKVLIYAYKFRVEYLVSEMIAHVGSQWGDLGFIVNACTTFVLSCFISLLFITLFIIINTYIRCEYIVHSTPLKFKHASYRRPITFAIAISRVRSLKISRNPSPLNEIVIFNKRLNSKIARDILTTITRVLCNLLLNTHSCKMKINYSCNLSNICHSNANVVPLAEDLM